MSNQNNNSSNASTNSDGNGTPVFNQQQQSARAAMLHSLSKLTQPQIQQLVAKYSKSIELANQAPPSSDLQKQHFATAAKIKEILINYSQLQKLKQQQQQANNNNNNNNNNSDNNNNGNSVSNATGNINMNNTTDNTITSNTNTTTNNNNNNNNNMNNTNPQSATAIRPTSSSSTDKQQQQAQPNLVNAPLMIQVQNLKRLSFIYQEHQKKLKSYKSFMERPNLTPDTVNKLRLEATQVQQKMEQIKVAIYKLNQSLKQNRVNLSTLAQKQNNNNNNNAGGNSIADNNSNDNNNTTSPGSNVSRTPNIGMAQLSSPVATGAASVLSPRNVASSPVMASQVSTPKTPVIAGSARSAIPSAGVAASVTTPQNNMNANSNAAAANITIPPAIMSKIQSSASVFIQQILAKGSVTLGGQEFNLNTMSPQHKVAFIKQISARYQQQQINLIKQRQLQQQQRQTNNAVATTNATTQQQQLLNQLMASNTMTPQQKAQILQRLQNSQRTAAQQQQNAVSVPGSPIVTPVPIRTNQQISIPKGGASSIQTNKSANNNSKRAIPQGLSISAPNAAVLGSMAGANVTTASVPGTPSVPATPLAATSDVSGGIGSAAGKKKSGSGSGRTQPVQGKSVSGSSGKSSKKNEAKKLKKLESGLSSGSGIDVSAVGGGGSGSHHRTSISTSSMSNSSGVSGQQQPVFSNTTNNKAVEKLKFNTVTENGRQQLFIHQGKMKRKIADIELYTPEADIIGKTAEFSASWKKHFTQSIPLASYKKTAHIKGILNTPKYLQLPEVTEIDQQNLDDSSSSTSTAVARTTGISGSSLTGSTSGSNTESVGSEGDLITKSKLKELIQSVNPNISIDGDVEDILLDISDEFIYNLCRFSCNLAKRRKTDSIEVKDVQLHLDRFYNIKIPGFDSDEIRNIRKWAPTNGYLNKISGVEVSRSVDRQEK